MLLETPSGNLPQIMRHINGAYTTYFNVKRSRSGHLFQGRYKAILVDIDEYAQELSRYIHLNPVRAKMAETPEEYNWSSYRYYIGKEKPLEWLQMGFILGYFGKKEATAQKKYHEYVLSLLNEKYNNPLDDVVSSALLGGPEFVSFIKGNFLSGKKPDNEIPALKALSEKATIQDIFSAVESEFNENESLNSDLKMFLGHKYTGERLKDIGFHFGIGESGVSQANRRVSEKIKSDKKLRNRIRKIEKKLNL